jgi:hypothetical protein
MSAWLRRDVESGDAHLVRRVDVVDLRLDLLFVSNLTSA